MRKIITGIAAIALMVVAFAATSPAPVSALRPLPAPTVPAATTHTQLSSGDWAVVDSSFCYARAQFAQVYGVVPIAKIKISTDGRCSGSSIKLVTVDSNNVLHNQGPCTMDNTYSLGSYSCGAAHNTPTGWWTEQVTGPNYQTAFGMVVTTCDPPLDGGNCVTNSFSVLG